MTSAPMPSAITPIVLTADEEDNLARTLGALRWARRVLVVDSGSTDGTERIARAHANVVFVTHPFRSFGDQWEFAIRHPAVDTNLVLALDADMVAGEAFVRELLGVFVPRGLPGGIVRFDYAVGGRMLLGSLYPPDVRVFDRSRVRVLDLGHAHRFEIEGPLHRFRARILHDDRKPLWRFLRSQAGYAEREEGRIRRGQRLRWRDRLRRSGLSVPVIFVLAWLRAGGPLRGRAALRYALERTYFETLLALRLADSQRPAGGDAGAP